jgi:3-vinyl bacteriochlorophyllide hydratase
MISSGTGPAMRHRRPASSALAALRTGDIANSPRKTPIISHHSDHLLSIDLYTPRYGRFTSPFDPGLLASYALWARSNASGGAVRRPVTALYTAEERRRRDASPWTIVQAVLAPVQFAVFLISLSLVIRYLISGDGLALANASVVIKTFTLYAIMLTGSIWEHQVFGRYLFARPFFWEDVFSLLVLALHTLYLAALVFDALAPYHLMLLALAAYAAYAVNATQFVLKLRAARRERPVADTGVAELTS